MCDLEGQPLILKSNAWPQLPTPDLEGQCLISRANVLSLGPMPDLEVQRLTNRANAWPGGPTGDLNHLKVERCHRVAPVTQHITHPAALGPDQK